MTITAADVNKLRKQTGAGMMDCKKALVETNGDFEAAIDYLRKKGQKVSEKRAGREAREGVVIAISNTEQNSGVVLHLSCETDFVAKNADFVEFAKSLTNLALSKEIESTEELMNQQLNGVNVSDLIVEQVGKIGEKIEVAQFARIHGELVVPYIHAGYRIGVLLALNKKGSEQLVLTGKDMAMQIAAMSPVAIRPEDVSEEIRNHEFMIGREQAVDEGKPENLVEKIATGRLNKFLKENTLMNQQFVKDSSKTVSQMLKEIDPDAGVTGFIRFAIG